jgi:hypothetical protein
MFDLETKSIVNLQLDPELKPTCIKCHPRKESLIAIGFKSGIV